MSSNNGVAVNEALHGSDSDEGQVGRWSLFMAFWAITSAIFMLYIGAVTALVYGTVDALIGIGLSIVSFSLLNLVLARHSIKNRVNVAQFSRTILGTSGSIITALILALTAIYYSVFEGSIVVAAFQAFFGGDAWIWSLVVVAYSTPLILGGVRKFLDKFNGWLLPVYLIGLVVIVVWAAVQFGLSDAWLTHAPETALPVAAGGPGWLATFAAYMGTWILMMYTMDYASLGKRKDIKFHTRITFTWPFWIITWGVNGLAGIFISMTIPGVDASEIAIAGGIVGMMGVLGLFLVVVFQTRINTANYYVAAANLQEFGQRLLRVKVPFAVWVLIGSAIIFLLMLLPVVQYLLVALAWQGVLVTSWVAIALTHIALNRSRLGEHGGLGDEHYKRFNVPGVIAWVVATAAGLTIVSVFPWGATWGPIITVVVASALYAGLTAALKQRTALVQTAPAPAAEQGAER